MNNNGLIGCVYMVDIYELFTEITKITCGKTISGDFTDENKQKLREEDWKTYELVKKICTLVVSYHDDSIDFQPGYIWEGKRTFAIRDMTDEDYLMLEKLDLSRLPAVLSYRIAEVLWYKKQDYKMAMKSCEYAEELFDESFNANRWTNSVGYLRRAITLAAKLGKKDEYQRLCDKCLDYAETVDPEVGCYAIIALLRILLEQKYDDKRNRIQSRLDAIIFVSTDVDKKTKAYELKIQFLNKDRAALSLVKKDFANMLIDDADKKETNNVRDLFIAEKNLMKAVQLLQSIGEKELVQKTKHKLIAVQSEIPKNMAVIKTKKDASETMQLISKLFAGLSVQEYVIRLAQCVSFYKKEDLKNNVLNSKTDFVSKLFGAAYKDSKGQTIIELPPLDIKDPEKDEHLIELYMFSEARMQEEFLGSNHLKWIIQILNKEYSFTEEDLKFLVENNPIIPTGRERIILKAIYEGLKGNIYLALHVLAPQLENIFRNIAESVGGIVITLEDDGTSQKKTLSSIFDLPELLECYDNDILFLFRGLLNEKAGSNIRNEIAHGVMSEETARSGTSVFLLCATIKLLSYTSNQALEIYNQLAGKGNNTTAN